MKRYLFTIILLFGYYSTNIYAQQFQASPSNWLFTGGNPEATQRQNIKSTKQDVSLFEIKWVNESIHGDVQPLIGNIINNPKINPAYPYSQNEIVAVLSGKVIVVDAAGKTHKINDYSFPYLNRVSALLDTLSTQPGVNSTGMLALGLETLEFQNIYDTLGYAYIGGFDLFADTVKLLRRLAVDLRKFKPNTFSSIKPICAKSNGSGYNVYSIVNMSKPIIDSTNINDSIPYFRGIAVFNSLSTLPNYPMPDIGDDTLQRVYLAPEINYSTPSIGLLSSSRVSLLPSCRASQSLTTTITNTYNDITQADKSYLFDYNLALNTIKSNYPPYDFDKVKDTIGKKPYLKQYYAYLRDPQGVQGVYKIIAEEYTGFDGSQGIPKIHLFDILNNNLTDIALNSSPFAGKNNHGWSIAVGDVDGNTNNEWLPYYPNNPGDEIITTYSSSKLAVAESKLCVLRYRPGSKIPKTSPPNSYLGVFDTIATQRINGWVAAVNDIDGANDGKEEIIMADNSTLRIMQLRNYYDNQFRSGRPFDTLYSYTFSNETIYYVSVADVDGDGLNDIVVTTNKGVYLVGILPPGTLKITAPIPPQNSYCIGDTIEIKWAGKNKFPNGLNFKYAPVVSGNVIKDSIVTVTKKFMTSADSGSFIFVLDSQVEGKQGKFIIEAEGSKTLSDTSALFNFSKAEYSLSDFWTKTYFAGDRIDFSGFSTCFDSLKIQYKFSGIGWSDLVVTNLSKFDTFNLNGIVPCPLIYSCDTADISNSISIRAIFSNLFKKDTGISHDVIVKPLTFPLTVDSNNTACPTKFFRWKANDIQYQCDTINILISTDLGSTFNSLARVYSKDELFIWKVPLNLPDNIMFRFCCESSCVRLDTTISGYKPKYIQIVAPNPFNPINEVAEIVYSVPDDMNVTIKVLDESNRLVREIINSQSRNKNTAYCEKWDGQRLDGTIAANGMYYISFELSNGQREIFPIFVRK